MTLRTYDEIRHLRNEKGKGAKAHPAIASGIVTGEASASLTHVGRKWSFNFGRWLCAICFDKSSL